MKRCEKKKKNGFDIPAKRRFVNAAILRDIVTGLIH